MKVGDKVYTYYKENFGNFLLNIVVVEGEVLSIENRTVYNIKGEQVDRDVCEIKCKHAGKKYLLDGIIDKVEENGEKYEWATVYQQSEMFNIWYDKKETCLMCIENKIKEIEENLNQRKEELEEMKKEIDNSEKED